MSDLEQRLRAAHPDSAQKANGSDILLEAADRLHQYREALEWISSGQCVHPENEARTALKETTDVD